MIAGGGDNLLLHLQGSGGGICDAMDALGWICIWVEVSARLGVEIFIGRRCGGEVLLVGRRRSGRSLVLGGWGGLGC